MLSPSLYAADVLCAASWASIPPNYHWINSKHANDKTLYKCIKRNNWCNRSSKVELSWRRELNFYVLWKCAPKKCEKIRRPTLPKLSSRLQESLILTILGVSKMTPPRATWTPRWLHVTLFFFLRWDKILPKVQKFCCSGHWHEWKIKSSLSPIDGT